MHWLHKHNMISVPGQINTTHAYAELSNALGKSTLRQVL